MYVDDAGGKVISAAHDNPTIAADIKAQWSQQVDNYIEHKEINPSHWYPCAAAQDY